MPINTFKSRYIVKDTEKEAKWGFSLAQTLGTDRSESAGEWHLSCPCLCLSLLLYPISENVIL
jgi:hypothetical protein